MQAEVRVEGTVTPSGHVGHTQLGFGRGRLAPTLSIEIRVHRHDLVEALGPAYDAYVSDTRDMWPEGDDDDPLVAARYPTLENVSFAPKLLWFVIRECLLFEFLEATASAERPTIFIHDLTSVEPDGDVLIFHGLCHSPHIADT